MKTLITILSLLLAAPLLAKEELVTLPVRDSVQLTIYNSEDLTLVRERRSLSFKPGKNRLQFSWANTLIDPTSVEFQPVGEAGTKALEILDISYPAESHEMLIWTIDCKTAGSYGVEISYFTSGISWRAEYTGIVSPTDDSVDLTAYITVTNNSGEEYEDAEVRLVIGVVNLVEKIIDLARPRRPYPTPPSAAPAEDEPNLDRDDMRKMAKGLGGGSGRGEMERPKEIQKAGLSEYYIYTVEGTETIPTGWSKRLRSFEVKGIPVKNVYYFKPKDYGNQFTKVYEFKNDEAHKLGKEPLPDGVIKLYRDAGQGRLTWLGAVASKYVPKNEEIKVNCGPDAEVTMKERRLSLKKKDIAFRNNWLVGYTTVETFQTELKNFRGRAVEVEIHRVVDGDYDFDGGAVNWLTEDHRTKKVRTVLKPGETLKLDFTATIRHNENARKK